jgi:glycosyltransferase involved in cell wall biosynthesis
MMDYRGKREEKIMSKLPITVCIIAKNEERFIGECIKALVPYGMEIIVADTGSVDNTHEIALKYADKVVDFEWINDFSAARNYCASFASNNWILALDCDEIVQSIDIRILRILMQKHPKQTGVIRLKNITKSDNGGKGYRNDDIPRFYNKNFYSFEFPIHEQIRPLDKSKKDDAIDSFLLPIDVIHYGYALNNDRMKEKQVRNLELLYKGLETIPDKGYVYFQIGRSEIEVNGYEKAIWAYEKAIENITDFDKHYVSELIQSLANTYSKVGRVSDGVAVLGKYADKFKDARYVFTTANLLWDDDQILKALAKYVKVLTLPDAKMLGGDMAILYGRIIKIYEAYGEHEMAENFHQQFLKYNEQREAVTETLTQQIK